MRLTIALQVDVDSKEQAQELADKAQSVLNHVQPDKLLQLYSIVEKNPNLIDMALTFVTPSNA